MAKITTIPTTENTVSRPVVAAAYANTSEVKIDSALTQETSKNLITITPTGQFCIRLMQSQGTEAYNFSRKAIYSFGSLTAKDADKLLKFAARFYGEISIMCDLREKVAGADTELKDAENAVKESADGWFLWVGTRKARKNDTKPRPAYGTRYADYAIFGEIAVEARRAAGDKLENIPEKFLELLMLATGRILTGNPLGRVSADTLSKAREKAVKARAAKAKETKAANEKEAQEKAVKDTKAKEEKERKDNAEKTAKIEKVAELGNLAMEAIRNSSATDDEKAQIIDLVKQLVLAAGK